MPDRGDGAESCRPRQGKRRRALSPSSRLGGRGNPAGRGVVGAYAARGGEPSERGHSAKTPAQRRARGYDKNSVIGEQAPGFRKSANSPLHHRPNGLSTSAPVVGKLRGARLISRKV